MPGPLKIATPADVARGRRNTPSPTKGMTKGTPSLRMTSASILAITTGPPDTLTLAIAGDPTPCGPVLFMEGYKPAVGDTVVVLVSGRDHLVMGRLAINPWLTPPPMGTDPSAWQNGWGPYSFGGFTYTAGYRREGARVFFKGLVAGGSAVTAFTLPLGFRPLTQQAVMLTAAQTPGSQFTVQVLIDGTVNIQPTGSGWVSLDGASFAID